MMLNFSLQRRFTTFAGNTNTINHGKLS
jgi:hypothetical protein